MSTNTLPTASLFRRLAALVYDSLILMALAMAYGAVALWFKYSVMNVPLAEDEKASLGPWGFAGLLLILEGFYWFFWCLGGQTLGMKAWRLKLFTKDGFPVKPAQAIKRGIVAPFSFGLCLLGFLWCLWDREGRTWHDLASGTLVAELPKKKR